MQAKTYAKMGQKPSAKIQLGGGGGGAKAPPPPQMHPLLPQDKPCSLLKG